MPNTYQKMVKKPLMKILLKHSSLDLREIWSIDHKFDCIFVKEWM